MVPFIVLVALFVLLSAVGRFHVLMAFGWWDSLRLALSGMFLLTASAHWGRRRSDLIRMVPSVFPRPEFLVTGTGTLEIAGAVGLALSSTAHYAALGLFLLLIAMFPANVHAARQRLTIAGRPVPDLLPRTLIQMAFLVSTLAVFLGGQH